MSKVKLGLYALVIVLALVGGFTVSRTVATLSQDYRDFKAMRAWVISVQKAQQQKQQAQKPQAQPPTP